MTIALPVIDRCTKLNLFRALRSVEMTPTASRVLQFLIDDRTAAAWSLRRLAIAVGRQPRTVDAAIADLKRLGFVTVLYRRRGTALKLVCVEAILQAVSRAVAIAKATAKAAIAMFRRGFQASQKSPSNSPLVFKIGGESVHSGGLTPQLRALLGLPRRE